MARPRNHACSGEAALPFLRPARGCRRLVPAMARSIRHAVPLVLAACVWAAPAHAQDDGYQSGSLSESEPTAAKGPVQINPPGSYEGVKPGGNQPPPVPAVPNTTPTQITWPGFQMRPDGSSRVFLQSTSPLHHSASQQGNMLTLDLGEAKVSGETNQFALYTRFFNTPVVRAQLKPGKRVVLEIELRAAVQPTITTEQAPSGFHFLYIDFPAGQYMTATLAKSPAGDVAPAAANAPAAPTHLDDAPPAPPEPKAKAKANASVDAELPPGQAKGKAKAGFKL